jgi:hypothetical protein
MSDKDFDGFLKYHNRCWGVKEVDDHGGSSHPIRQSQGTVSAGNGDAEEDGRAPLQAADDGAGYAEADAGKERLPTDGDRPAGPDLALIRKALENLDPKNKEHWTTGGLPRVDVVSDLCKEPNVTRRDIEAAWPDFQGNVQDGDPK